VLGVYTVSTYLCYTKAILMRRKLRNNSRTTTAYHKSVTLGGSIEHFTTNDG